MITALLCAVGGRHLSGMHERRIHEARLPRCGRIWVTALPLRTGAKKSGLTVIHCKLSQERALEISSDAGAMRALEVHLST